jgi:hypothetical protein
MMSWTARSRCPGLGDHDGWNTQWRHDALRRSSANDTGRASVGSMTRAPTESTARFPSFGPRTAPIWVLQTAFFALEIQSLSPEAALRVLERLQDAGDPRWPAACSSTSSRRSSTRRTSRGRSRRSRISSSRSSFSLRASIRLDVYSIASHRIRGYLPEMVDSGSAGRAFGRRRRRRAFRERNPSGTRLEAVLRAWDGFPGDSVADVWSASVRLFRDWSTEVLSHTARMGAGTAGQVRVADIVAIAVRPTARVSPARAWRAGRGGAVPGPSGERVHRASR